MTSQKLKLVVFFSAMFSSLSANAAVICDGKITQVLSGAPYCEAGQRIGFFWTGGGNWICSGNKNMDALIITAFMTGKTVSVRDSTTWSSCSPPTGSVPDHVWVLQ